LYVVNANYLHIGQRYYKFEAEDNVLLAVYPIERTIIKSIETSKKD
jgi:hypothetical protein